MLMYLLDEFTFPKTTPTLTLCLLVLSLITSANSLDPDQTKNVKPELDLNCLTL